MDRFCPCLKIFLIESFPCPRRDKMIRYKKEGEVRTMPEITRFYGIIIKIFFRNEHNPPHIHAIYGEHNGLFSIADMQMLEGDLPARAVKLVQEWGTPFTEDLLQMWNTKQLRKLPPLK